MVKEQFQKTVTTMYGSECWVLNKIKVVEMGKLNECDVVCLRWIKFRNDCIRKSLGVMWI